ncbi:DoxX family protein [Actinocrispum wychmicini]|uniref:Putative oxidoreductase n=1 Tax=Actinocrispum wychmicini TaxID=1213861 RepID=A0A4R2K4D7_9PSEU|nr:DoxX family protein [Actinocrispum wychmicini]TCO64648.1 putative oxidoreductase [Actinocrispum wychmicini]
METILRRREDLLSLFRFVVGVLFACHGIAKLFGMFGGKTVTFGSWPSWFSAVIEFGGGLAVMLGVGTRIAALLCSGEMAYAYFTTHQPKALWPIENGGELAAVYSWVFLLIAIVGPGSYTLTKLWQRAHQPSLTE